MSVLFWDASGPLAYLSFPGSAFLVNAISWISLVLGLFFSLPFVLFVVYDILLWIWRTYRNFSNQPQNAQIPVTAGTISTKATAISSEHHDQRARRR
ncbi:uncharacterized protein TrAFT101_001436 [Trichoderma asperellum]|uniref:Uncharacterized protein n=1 Tax=Trichoderma asperellum (strain ATCC 204424 / CBS 433.97 / NBRC 101777) TaxID=1042311 RepID=A0A2T3ZDH1_TRIA4|nr:hypothetical protein M441DRAFT_360269 [Trichoderma asperellum CBS 433.97]PTB42858.1 hypothetical protein M441DRAFT_360269 [Trichoderma asperellum CBS 433.97]UKZ85580.1 hypothetical protein TrAFT101_001436 [Trichoderma asperellum]